jgi:hypothetical protein
MQKLSNIVTVGVFGWETAHEAVTRRPPICLYTYDVGVWDLCIILGPFSVARAKPY